MSRHLFTSPYRRENYTTHTFFSFPATLGMFRNFRNTKSASIDLMELLKRKGRTFPGVARMKIFLLRNGASLKPLGNQEKLVAVFLLVRVVFIHSIFIPIFFSTFPRIKYIGKNDRAEGYKFPCFKLSRKSLFSDRCNRLNWSTSSSNKK